jgi:non-heme chloroperoxidase
MSTVTTKDGVEIFYKDWGSGRSIVFHHGWPLSADDWDAQMLYFAEKSTRLVAARRRTMSPATAGAASPSWCSLAPCRRSW